MPALPALLGPPRGCVASGTPLSIRRLHGNMPGWRPTECPNCRAAYTDMGVEKFRIGGTSGGWKMLFGEWAELGEAMLPLQVVFCPQCSKVEFYMVPPDGQQAF